MIGQLEYNKYSYSWIALFCPLPFTLSQKKTNYLNLNYSTSIGVVLQHELGVTQKKKKEEEEEKSITAWTIKINKKM